MFYHVAFTSVSFCVFNLCPIWLASLHASAFLLRSVLCAWKSCLVLDAQLFIKLITVTYLHILQRDIQDKVSVTCSRKQAIADTFRGYNEQWMMPLPVAAHCARH